MSRKRQRRTQDAQSEQQPVQRGDRLPDDASVRAKSSGHKKKTADKWNQ